MADIRDNEAAAAGFRRKAFCGGGKYVTRDHPRGTTVAMKHITSIEDLRQAAQRRVPKAFFDYAEAGSYEQSTLRANRDDLDRIKLRQRILVDVSQRSVATTILGEPAAVAYIVFKTAISIGLWGAAVIGFLGVRLGILERALAVIAAFTLIAAVPMTDEIGFGLAIVFAMIVWRKTTAAKRIEVAADKAA